MKKTFAVAGIFMLAAIAYSSVYAVSDNPNTSTKEVTVQQNAICPGNVQNSMEQMGSHMQGVMGNFMGSMMGNHMNGRMDGKKEIGEAKDGSMVGHQM